MGPHPLPAEVACDHLRTIYRPLNAHEVFADLTAAARHWWDVADRREVADLRQAIANIITLYREHQVVLHAAIAMSAYDADIADGTELDDGTNLSSDLRFSPPEGDAELARVMTEIVWRSLYAEAAEAG